MKNLKAFYLEEIEIRHPKTRSDLDKMDMIYEISGDYEIQIMAISEEGKEQLRDWMDQMGWTPNEIKSYGL